MTSVVLVVLVQPGVGSVGLRVVAAPPSLLGGVGRTTTLSAHVCGVHRELHKRGTCGNGDADDDDDDDCVIYGAVPFSWFGWRLHMHLNIIAC